MMSKKFTTKQRAFIEAYLGEAKYNALESARIAGYSSPVASAGDLMKDGHPVKQEIEKRLRESLPSENELLNELKMLAYADEGNDWIKARDKRQAIKDFMELRGKLEKKFNITVSSVEEIKNTLGLIDDEGEDE